MYIGLGALGLGFGVEGLLVRFLDQIAGVGAMYFGLWVLARARPSHTNQAPKPSGQWAA